MPTSTRPKESSTPRSDGLTLIELLIVIVLLGTLSGIVVFAARGVSAQGTASACETDRMNIEVAVAAYFAQYGGSFIPVQGDGAPTGVNWTPGATPDETLVIAGNLHEVSPNFQTSSDGTTFTPTPTTKCT